MSSYGFTEWHRRRASSITSGFVYEVDASETLDELREIAWNECEEREGNRREDDSVVVNYLRHCRTLYEWQLQRAEERQGGVHSERASELAYEIVRARNTDAIAHRFPELAVACSISRKSSYMYGSSRRR